MSIGYSVVYRQLSPSVISRQNQVFLANWFGAKTAANSIRIFCDSCSVMNHAKTRNHVSRDYLLSIDKQITYWQTPRVPIASEYGFAV